MPPKQNAPSSAKPAPAPGVTPERHAEPPPAATPKPGCEPTPEEAGSKDARKPACPEGYPERQPTDGASAKDGRG